MDISTIAYFLAVFCAGFAISWLGAKILIAFAPRWRLVDDPTGRKVHHAPVPLVGGMAVILGGGIAAITLMLLAREFGALRLVFENHFGFFIGAIILAVIGILDDRNPIPASYKLAFQFIACTAAVFLDNTLVGAVSVGGIVLTPGPLIVPFTILVMLTITNAINMIDGLDGLAAGITFAGLAPISKAVIAASYGSAPFVIAFLGGLAGFLAYNFPFTPKRKASLFLGDSGSLVLGFALAYMAVDLSALPNRVFDPSTALWFFFVPVSDTIWLYLRRTITAGTPFAAGRDHIHHLLLEYLPAYAVTWILVGVSVILAALAYLCDRLGVPSISLLIAWIVAFFVYGAITQKGWCAAWARSHIYRKVSV